MIDWNKYGDRLSAEMHAIAHAVAKEEIALALRDLRPGGAHPFAWEIPMPSADPALAVSKVIVLYPCVVTSVDLFAAPGESATVVVDLWVARPGQTLSQGVSICGGNLPALAAGDHSNTPVDSSWSGIPPGNLEPGSVLMLVIAQADSVSSLGVCVNVCAL